MIWQTTRFRIALSRPQVMGIVNITPDSFSDGGSHPDTRSALAHCERLLQDGADILDLGAESTRPGAVQVPVDQELARLLPVLREAVKLGVPVSIDTYKPRVMQAALDLGADIVNDIWALRWQDTADPLDGRAVVAGHPTCGVCLMHMHGEPRTMQISPMEGDVLPAVSTFLADTAQGLRTRGVAAERIVLDPGIGFGKTVAQNFSLLARQEELLGLGYALLAGWSRKSSLGAVASPRPGSVGTAGQHERMAPSIAAALLAVERGAAVVRVHDVRETVQALQVLAAIK
ncbi:MAG TPA: dihydropteroate synthase [Curvibacter sp.]|nr:dihydropteroate synthase [Curvibacter sp.]